jgi:DNA-binding LytR/AlgR family response regulator
MKINCLIVDDEPPAVDELNYILSRKDHVTVVGAAYSAEHAIEAIKALKPDLVFLDIKMPGLDGFEVVKACSQLPDPPFFVFATAYDEHAVEAFEASAVDYILKPVQAERVQESIERVKQLMSARHHRQLYSQLENLPQGVTVSRNYLAKISVEHKGKIRLLDPESIVFCKAENKATLAYTESQCHPLHGATSLDMMEAKLARRGFFRSHRSYLVNLAYIKEVVTWFNGKYILTMADQQKTEVPVSRRRARSLKEHLGL